jgi:Ca2+-binding RTX toxin-like protein
MTSTRPQTLILVDSAVNDYESLVNHLRADAEVVMLHPHQDGVEQITEVLAERQSLESLHILSHGDAGKVYLGATQLSADTLDHYAEKLSNWAASLTPNADILLYGCDVAADEMGQQFVEKLSHITQANIAASTNLTGDAAQGGDWDLEFTVGDVQTPIAFQAAAIAAYRHTLGLLFQESFRTDDVTDKSFKVEVGTVGGVTSAQPFLTARPTGAAPAGGLAGNPGVAETSGDGALRLTSNTNNQSAFVLYDKPISASQGISVTFDFFAYNGSTGADGISFFLVDAAETRPITAGGFGGSLGYANSGSTTGLEGGYVGIGFDEFGNFSDSSEGRNGPVSGTNPGRIPDSISVRGRETTDPLTQYRYLTGTGTLTPGIDDNAASTRTPAKRTAQIDITPVVGTTGGRLTVKVDLNGDGDFLDTNEAPTELSNYDLVGNNGALPANFKFGFASSTGASTNIHEIRNLLITTAQPGVTFSGAGVLTNPTTGAVSLTTAEGGTPTTVSAVLGAAPTSNVTLNLSSGDTTEGTVTPASLVFTPTNWFTPQTFTITPVDDTLVDGSVPYNIVTTLTTTDPTYSTLNPTDIAVTNTDNEGPVNTPPVVPTIAPPAVNPGQTVSVTGLTATDSDGIGFYTITSVPPASQGTLFLGDPTRGGSQITVGQNLTPAQIGQIFFQAAPDFTGTNFTYTATDTRGATSSPRTVAFEGVCVNGTPINGTNARNTLNGTDGVNDFIFGRGGNDVLRGQGCNDLLDGGAGNDRLLGGTGRDTLRGRLGNDTMLGDAGNDILNGGLGNDRLDGGEGDDLLKGRRGQDLLIGGTGNDRMLGGLSNDRLRGGAGDDILDGGRGDDFVKGGGGNDILTGRTGRDTVLGLAGDDRLRGGLGADLLVGGAGADIMTGNRGRDTFEYRNLNEGGDTITDFEANRDLINLSRVSGGRSFSDLVTLTQSGSDTLVRVGGNTLATLTGVTASSLGASNFVV